MKPTAGLPRVGIVIVIANLFVVTLSLYVLKSYMSPDSCATEASLVSLSSSAGNCSCNLSYVSPPGESSSWLPSARSPEAHGVNTSTNDSECAQCKACPLPEVHVVEKEVVKKCPNVPWYAEDRVWHYPAGFPLCSMDVCFNYSKCENMDELKVFTYDLPSPPIRNFYQIKESKYWTDDPEKACLLFVFIDTSSPWPKRPRDLPYWNGGLNHVLITFGDRWERKGPAADSIGNASIMATISYETTHRPGFDISIPLPGKVDCSQFQSTSILQRKYFATFRGTRYLGEKGEGVFRSHASFRGLHNGKDVVVATTCRHRTNDLARKEHPEIGQNCDEDDEVHRRYDFFDLMNTTFALVPAGRQPNSFRFIEVLSAGSIPVLIADNYVKPFDTMIRWHDCLLQFPTSQMHRIIPTLRAMKNETIIERQRHCLRFWNEFLKDDNTLQESAMRALKERFLGVFPNFAEIRSSNISNHS